MADLYPCPRPGCLELTKLGHFHSRSCSMRFTRMTQTPEKRREIARTARQSQLNDAYERFKARVLLEPTKERQLWVAWQYVRGARRTAEYRARQREERA